MDDEVVFNLLGVALGFCSAWLLISCYSLYLSLLRKHEQEQHDKEISDLVHGIAAGNLWKRRNGQADDMDIFDEDDINGRFRRKKKLKVSEKFEKLGMRPFSFILFLCTPAGM